jgi:hypothetical protein
MSGPYIPPIASIVEDDGESLSRIVGYPNGVQAEQYFDVDSGTWMDLYDDAGNLLLVEEDEQFHA